MNRALCSKSDAGKDEIRPVKEAADKVRGWLTDAEGEFLYNAARNCKGNGVIVEIGSWEGKSTIWLAKGAKAGRNIKIYAIDPHTGTPVHQKSGGAETLEEFKENIKRAGVEDIVVPIVKTSQDAARDWEGKPIELLWIDGGHAYHTVKSDFDLWSPYLVEGGTIAFHDSIGWPGPKKVVEDEIYTSANFAKVGLIDTLTYARKVAGTSLAERLRSWWVLLLKNICEFGLKLRLPKPVKNLGRRIVRLVQ